MSLKNKTKVYLSLDQDSLSHVKERSVFLGKSRARYISDLLKEDYEKHQKKKIDKIIEGVGGEEIETDL